MEKYQIPVLPLSKEVETKKVLKKVADARAALAELKGVHATVPNVGILLNTLALQEAKDSSAVENIITTHDELFRAELNLNLVKSVAAKEVQRYSLALKRGFELVQKNKLITTSVILELHELLEQNNAGYRRIPGTDLKNDKTKELVYTPPQSFDEIQKYMLNLVDYMNDESMDDLDHLVKMAIIHHQFESIHPFYDGNGRLGRIINILYLISKDLLDFPSLYLSRFINQNKGEYYRLLQGVRDNDLLEERILFILDAIISVSQQSVQLIKKIKLTMMEYKNAIRSKLPKIYSQDLINNLFKHPYTKIDFLQEDLKIIRQTSSKYLNEVADLEDNLLSKMKIGREFYFINNGLMALFSEFDYKL
jgi:Fic family protein